MNSPAQIGVFFDLDGTLLESPSLEWRFISYLLAHDEINRCNLMRWLQHFSKNIFRDPHVAIHRNKLYLGGLRKSLVTDWLNSHDAQGLRFFAEGIARMVWHHSQQHRIFLLTGTPAALARAIAPRFPCSVQICSTELEVLDRHWTGFLAGNHMRAEMKARAVRTVAAQHGLALERSFAYGNHTADRAMLEVVGHPVAVNPSVRLRIHARMRGWHICRWHHRHAAVPIARKDHLAPEQVR